MCLKDKIIQSLYHNNISWSDIPSDDDILELDDWKSYNKVKEYAKTSYQQVYNIRRRREKMSFTIKKQHNNTRVPYITLKQNHFEPLCYDLPVKISLAEVSPIKISPIEVSHAEVSIITPPILELSDIETPLTESIEESIEEPIEEPIIEPIIETPIKNSPTKKIFHIKKLSIYQRKSKEKEKKLAKKMKKAISIHTFPRKKRVSLCKFFTIFSTILTIIITSILVCM